MDTSSCPARCAAAFLWFTILLNALLFSQEAAAIADRCIIDVSSEALQQYMGCVEKMGAEYGMALNWQKTEVAPMRCRAAG